ncbi:hypothetical protein BD413DRAFT_439056, partial [Trametes elegans]
LYRDLLDDTVELRYPREHLPLLFTGKLATPTRILVDVDISWWMKLYFWMFSCYMRNGKSCPTVSLRTLQVYVGHSRMSSDFKPVTKYDAPQDPADISAATAPPSTLFFSMLYESTPSISLDCVPYHTLEECIRQIQSTLAPGTYLTIGLTTRAGPAAHNFSDPTTILTVLPFFPREYLRGRSENKSEGGGSERTTMPLFVTLPRVLGLLTSGPSPLTIELVRNVSAEYAAFLRRSVHDLEDDWEIRDAFVREWGLRAWREERVCTAWEAALVDAGLLAGWAIVVHKAE